jgi:NAD(P)H-hydrate epimerase
MATAGSGDVLTGIIAGIAAQGYSSDDAACLGVYLHGLAGDSYAQKKSKASLVASDLIEHLGNTKLLD